jgi:hypothetical protein
MKYACAVIAGRAVLGVRRIAMGARKWISGSMVAGVLVLSAATTQASSALAQSGQSVAVVGDAPMIGGVKPIRRDEAHSMPEPATGALMLAGGLTLAARKYWRSRRQARETKGDQ